MTEFLLRSLLAAVGAAAAAGPLGCFVVWRRMAYFGDATAHAAILGVALAITLEVSVFGGVLVVAMAMASSVSFLSERGFATDTLLGVMAHSALAFALVTVSLLDGVRIDLMAYLFGDILAINWNDVAVIWTGAVLVIGLLVWRWDRLLTATLSPDLAYANGINPKLEKHLLTLGLALVVAVAIKVVGVLLIASMLLIPPATARAVASTPGRMAIWATFIGATASALGLVASYEFDTPAGPSIVCVAAMLFVIASLYRVSKTR